MTITYSALLKNDFYPIAKHHNLQQISLKIKVLQMKLQFKNKYPGVRLLEMSSLSLHLQDHQDVGPTKDQ
jgi:hypothetical protein